MLRRKMVLALVAMLTLGAGTSCTKSSDASNSQPQVAIATDEVRAETPVAPVAPASNVYVPGVASHSSDVVSLTVYATEGGAASGAELAPIFVAYPKLGADSAELGLVNRVVMTTDSKIELYNVNDLVLVLHVADGVPTVFWTRSEFSAESIVLTSDATDPKSMVSTLLFNMKACAAAVPPDQGQDKGQDKGQVKEPVCQTISALVDMKETPQKQDQSQDEGKTKP